MDGGLTEIFSSYEPCVNFYFSIYKDIKKKVREQLPPMVYRPPSFVTYCIPNSGIRQIRMGNFFKINFLPQYPNANQYKGNT